MNSMEQFEYKTLHLRLDRRGFFSQQATLESVRAIESELNWMGQTGWRLIAVFPFTNGGSPAQIDEALHYFCRRRSGPHEQWMVDEG